MKRVLLILFLLLLVSPALAERIEVHQGDFVYENETVDISLAGSWPDYTLAWCASNNPECNPPDQVIPLKGNLHVYWMNPAIYKNFGDYYRWSGKWNRGENALAFRYKPGARPVYAPNLSGNLSANETPQLPVQLGPFRWVIARGDNPSFTIVINRTDPCHLWVWADSDTLYNIPLQNDNSTYFVSLTKEQTFGIREGDYKAYLQFNGRNGIQDIYYKDMYLLSPYNNKIAPIVPLVYWNLGNARMQYDEYATSIQYYDDEIIPVEFILGEPTMTITSVLQEEDKLYITGSTNWKSNTSITLQLDPENYPLAQDARWHTWTAWASGDMDSPREFSTAVKISASDISIGPHHIDMQKQDDPNSLISSYDFKRTDTFVMPTPTPVRVAVLTSADYAPLPTRLTAPEVRALTTAPTPVPVATAVPVPGLTPGAIPNDMTGTAENPVIVNSNTSVVVTATPTYDPNIHVPVPVWVPVLALLVLVFRRQV